MRFVSTVALLAVAGGVQSVSAQCGACAPQCGTFQTNSTCASYGGIQQYPAGAYINGVSGNNTLPPTFCVPEKFDGTTLECPIQYDGPAGAEGTQDLICYVSDPILNNGSTAAVPYCYNPLEQTCTGTNFLCDVAAPLACGRACFDPSVYVCITDATDFYNSQLLLRNQTGYTLDTTSTTPAPQDTNSAATCPTGAPSSAPYDVQCGGQCATVCGANHSTNACEMLQSYPSYTYVTALNGVSTVPAAECVPEAYSGIPQQCPIQYDGPAGAEGTQDLICYVSDPILNNGSTAAVPYCYNPLEQTCTGTNFLCDVKAPYACGRACFDADVYVCVVDSMDFYGSQLVLRNTTTFTVGPAPGTPAVQPTPVCPTTTPAPTSVVVVPSVAGTTPAAGQQTNPTTTVTVTVTPAPTCDMVSCAPTCGADAFTPGQCDLIQSYPTGAYVDITTMAPVAPQTPCRAPSQDGIALQCPIQYDGPIAPLGTQDNICYVYYPSVFGDELAHPFCYNPLEQTCTGTNFLCAVDAPLACGAACFSPDKYTCEVDSSNFMASKLVAKIAGAETGATSTFAGQQSGTICSSTPGCPPNTATSVFTPPMGECGCAADTPTNVPSTIGGSTDPSTSPSSTPAASSTGTTTSSTGAGNTGSNNKASSAANIQNAVALIAAVATAVIAM